MKLILQFYADCYETLQTFWSSSENCICFGYYTQIIFVSFIRFYVFITIKVRERSGSVVECMTRNRGAAGSSLTCVTALCSWARHISPSLVLVQPRKTRPYVTERLLMGSKESNQTNKQTIKVTLPFLLKTVEKVKEERDWSLSIFAVCLLLQLIRHQTVCFAIKWSIVCVLPHNLINTLEFSLTHACIFTETFSVI